MRAIVLRGASLADFWLNIVMLAGMGVAVFSLCALRFKRKIADVCVHEGPDEDITEADAAGCGCG